MTVRLAADGPGDAVVTPGQNRRSIPAQVGEPLRLTFPQLPRRVYPRAGGGTLIAPPMLVSFFGLSPRRRGNRSVRPFPERAIGSIPAQAGEPPRISSIVLTPRVYPRAGGGTAPGNASTARHTGQSPRRRGNLVALAVCLVCDGSIPAQAGEPRARTTSSRATGVYPRAGGGTAYEESVELTNSGLSPRRRGNREAIERRRECSGSIPAQAGELASARSSLTSTPVYPRAGGGTGGNEAGSGEDLGLSPRRRGNRVRT